MPASRILAPGLVLFLVLPLGLGSSIGAPDPYGQPGPFLDDGYRATPLAEPTPSSYTDDVREKVIAAAERGNGYDPAGDREVPLSPHFLFIRPGAWMYSPSWCTMGFVFGTPGKYKISSAGHCAADGEEVVLSILVTTGTSGVLVGIGTVERSHDNGVGDDWSMVGIRRNMQRFVDPGVALLSGPQGPFSGSIVPPDVLLAKHVGHGVGTGGAPRVGLATFAGEANVPWLCHCAATTGDSGSPVLVVTPGSPLGEGLGILTHFAGGPDGLVAGTRLTAIPYDLATGGVDLFRLS